MLERTESDGDLNAVRLQNAVLCVDCEVVSNSPNDCCLVCGSRSLINLSRVMGGALPDERATIICVEEPAQVEALADADAMVHAEDEDAELSPVVYSFPSPHKNVRRKASLRKSSRRRA